MLGARLSAPDGVRRADLDRARADDIASREAVAEALASAFRRLDELEKRAGAAPGAARTDDVAVLATTLSDEIRALREGLVRDLGHADARLAELERRVDELASLAALVPVPASRPGPLSEEDEAVWLNLARDADALRRFSALAVLGRTRTDRSVLASSEALKDPAEIVVWQAIRNLGRFQDRSAAPRIAPFLRHGAVALRDAADEALRGLGAPDAGFHPAALPEERRAAAEALERWAEAQ